VTRPFLAAATALLAAGTLLSSAAEACISCEYVPEVVRQHTTDHSSSGAYAYGRVRASIAHEPRSTATSKRRVAKRDDAPKSLKITKAAKAETIEKPKTVAKTVAKADPAPARKTDTESSSITVASAEADAAPAKQAAVTEAVARPTDCKKFFASVGMTLTVPCE